MEKRNQTPEGPRSPTYLRVRRSRPYMRNGSERRGKSGLLKEARIGLQDPCPMTVAADGETDSVGNEGNGKGETPYGDRHLKPSILWCASP